MKPLDLISCVLLLSSDIGVPPGLHAAPAPTVWVPRGAGGGGALFSPALSPHQPDHCYVACDMSELFFSHDAGLSWETLPFRQIQGGNRTAPVQFTSDPDVLYALDFGASDGNGVAPKKSVDAGRTWTYLPRDPTEGEAYSLHADPDSTERVLISNYDTIFISSDGGLSFRAVFTTNDCHVAGVFFDGDEIFVGTRAGLLVSTNGGSSFAMAAFSGLPTDEAMVSFAGARQNGMRRLFCVTRGWDDVWPVITGADHWGYRGIYRLDVVPNAAWTRAVTGIDPEDHPFFVGMARNRIDIAYVAGGSESDLPVVFKTVDGGGSWTRVLHTTDNGNIRTGWQGDSGDRQWSYAENVLGLAVSPSDPNRVLITDLGFAHLTVDGGQSWSQRYVESADENPAGSPTPTRKSYQSVGLENTSCWWLIWSSEMNLFACFADIHGLRSTDGGVRWGFDFSGQDLNSSFHAVRHPATGRLFLAVSSIHDLYQSTRLDDESIDGGEGRILYSDDQGATWQTLHDFGHPVIWLALDPNDADRLYASVVHRIDGGIYMTQNARAGANATWNRLASPPRTEGHPFNVLVLRDGTLVATYSGRLEGDAFTRSSGLFVSTDGGATWEDRSHPGMVYWTGDVVIDPHDPNEQTWYVGVSSGWGGPPNDLGGLYQTSNRGATWVRINALNRVRSCAIHPADPNIAYLSTEEAGLWFTSNLASAQPTFSEVPGYPFKNPLRVFFNPYHADEVWVTSFGNGLRVARMERLELRFLNPRVENGRFQTQIQAASGLDVIISASADFETWIDVSTNRVDEGGIAFEAPTNGAQFYRARVRAESPSGETPLRFREEALEPAQPQPNLISLPTSVNRSIVNPRSEHRSDSVKSPSFLHLREKSQSSFLARTQAAHDAQDYPLGECQGDGRYVCADLAQQTDCAVCNSPMHPATSPLRHALAPSDGKALLPDAPGSAVSSHADCVTAESHLKIPTRIQVPVMPEAYSQSGSWRHILASPPVLWKPIIARACPISDWACVETAMIWEPFPSG